MSDNFVTEFVPSGLVELGLDGTITDANGVFVDWAGVARDDLIGRRLETVLRVGVDVLASALKAAGRGPMTTILQTDSSEPRAITVSATITPSGTTVVAVMDATLQQRFESDLLRREGLSRRESERLQLMLSASVAFADALTDDELGEILVDVARRSLSATSASVHLIEDGRFRTVAGHNPMAEYLADAEHPMGERAVQLGRAFEIDDPSVADELFPGQSVGEAMTASGTHAVIASPVLDHGTPIGVLACFFDHERHFDEQAEPLIRALAQQSAPVFARLRLEADLRHASMLDEVTNLPTRRLMESNFHESDGSRQPCTAVLFLDLDRFKRVNDELGHAAGDRLLREVADRLKAVFRAEDAVARYGGDEFVAILAGLDNLYAGSLAERARATIAQPFDWLPVHLQPTASVGIGLNRLGANSLPAEQVIRAADHAMYAAKAAGGNRVASEQA